MKVIVVGTSHAGYEATQTLLKEMPEAEIHLYERGATASFLSCGIQSFLNGESDSLDSLHYANEESYKKQGVNIHVNSDVVAVNPDKKTVTVKTADGEHEESYDKLMLSPGAAPKQIPIEGKDLEHVYYVRGREWAGAIKERMETAKKAMVIGAGYIGVEVATSFQAKGIDTVLLDGADRILPVYLDKEFTDVLEEHGREKGMTINTGEFVKEIVGENGKVSKVVTDKNEYEVDTVILSPGVAPVTDYLEGVLDLNEDGTVKVNDHLETSVKDIYAAGDATRVPFKPDGSEQVIALATNARRQGVVAALNIAGKDVTMPAVSGTSGLAFFDYHFAQTGTHDIDLEKEALCVDVESHYVEEKVRPDFMNDDVTVAMKIFYETDSHRILGAQMMSKANIVESINTLSLAVSAEMTLEDLALADFFFQPEYNRPWNYLNVLAQSALGHEFGSDKMLF